MVRYREYMRPLGNRTVFSVAVFFAALTFLCVLPILLGAETLRERGERDATREPREVREIRGIGPQDVAADHILVKRLDRETAERVRLSGGESVHGAIARFNAEPDVEYAEPDHIAYAFAVPNDAFYSFQWHLDNNGPGGIGMEEAWDLSSGAGVVVAVIDTGVAYENYTAGNGSYYLAPDLAGTSFVAGRDFVNNDAHANDDNGHGTHVAGTIAQSTGNSIGVAGVAYSASIMPLKVLNASGSGTYSAIAEAIRFAADNGAKVINLSLGGSSGSETLRSALQYAFDMGVTIIAAAGNNGSSSISYPAAYNDYVIAVGATGYNNTRASYSNYGAGLDLVAPGGELCAPTSPYYCITNDQNGDGYGDGVLQQTFSGATNNFGYYFYQGTSMAAPHVAGVAALVISRGNATTPGSVRAALETTTRDLGVSGWDSIYGYGLRHHPRHLHPLLRHRLLRPWLKRRPFLLRCPHRARAASGGRPRKCRSR